MAQPSEEDAVYMAQGTVPGAPRATALVPLTDEAVAAMGAHLIQIRGPFDAYAAIDPEDKPAATFPELALLNLLGPELTCQIVKEAERVKRRAENTHLSITLHFHRGEPAAGEVTRTSAVDLRPVRVR